MLPLTITDVATRLGVHPNTVRTMIARGELSAVHVGIAHAKRRTLRIMESELESFTRSRSQVPEPKREPRLSAKRRAFRAMISQEMDAEKQAEH